MELKEICYHIYTYTLCKYIVMDNPNAEQL